MDRIEKRICYTQSQLYGYAFDNGYDPKTFSNLFLSSDFCSRQFDTDYSHYQYAPSVEIFENVSPEIESDLIKKQGVNEDIDVVKFVGYMYRFLYYATSVPSKELVKIVPYMDVEKHYDSSLMLSPEYIADDICKNYGLTIVDNDVKEYINS